MKKILTLAAWMLTALSANADDRMVQCQTWYGDNMGATSEATATRRIEYLYDADNKLSRRIQTGLMENGTDWMLTNYYLLDYDKDGHLRMTYSMQYGIYDQNNYALKASNDTIVYRYNGSVLEEEANVAKKTNIRYSYNDEGQLIRAKIYKNLTLSQILTYSDFVKGGAQKVTATAKEGYNCYNGTMTYNDEGQKTSELRYDTLGTLIAAEYWTYNAENQLATYEKKGISGGKEVDSQKTVYTVVDEFTTRSVAYTYSNGEWKKKGGSTCETQMADFNEGTACVLNEVKPNAEASSVELQFSMPEVYIAVDMEVAFNIYRDGLLVGQVPNLDVKDYTYTDKDVMNGKHEYFIQTVIHGQGQNISNIVKTEMKRDYPRATAFRATKARKTTEGQYKVTLAWTAPEVTEEMKFVNHNIMKIGTYYTTPMLEEDEALTKPNANTIEVSFGIDPVQTIFLQTRYEGGTVQSDTITVDAAKLMGKVDEANRTLHTIETWGDAMGHDTGITSKEVTFYGPDNRVQRKAKYSKALGSTGDSPADWTISEYTRYIYGESGQVEKEYTQQYGRYDHGGMGFRAAQDTTFYEFNLEGQKTLESNRMGYTEYKYGADGSLIEAHTVEYAVPDNLEQTLTYSNFAGKDKPQMTVSTGTRTSQQYMLETEYDEDGNKTNERKSNYSTSKKAYVISTVQEFYYNNGELESDTVFSVKIVNDIEQYSYKSYTSYEPEEGNANRVKVVKKVWDTILKKFGNPKTYTVYEYTDINGEKYSPKVEIELPDGGCNSLCLNVDIPNDQRTAMTALNVYRNGIEIGHAIPCMDEEHYETDEFGMNGVWRFQDNSMPNGRYDYYVELVQLNASLTEVAQRHNISNVVEMEFNTALPRPTRLREVSRRNTTTQNTEEGTTELNVFIQLAWDKPVTPEPDIYMGDIASTVTGYEVMVVGSQVAENYDAADKTGTTYEVAMRGLKEMQIYVDAIYPIGRASSDTITLSEIPTGIESMTVVDAQRTQNDIYFNLRGQKAAEGEKGILIRNRKKTLKN